MSGSVIPAWLPEPLQIMPWNEHTYDYLYEVFCDDFLKHDLSYRGHNVWFYPDCEEDGREGIFWHLTSREEKRPRRHRGPAQQAVPEENPPRYPDPARCELLSWVRPMILRCPCADGDLLDWDYEEGDGVIKTYIWVHQHNFLVVLKRLGDGRRRLITSYHLDNDHQVQKTRKKWERRIR